MLLAADIGGTKTDLALFSRETGPRAPLAHAQYHSTNYADFETMVREFLADIAMPVRYACFDVAGPVVAGHAHLTNLPWEVDAAALQRDLKLEAVWVLNDLVAIAHAVPLLTPDDLHTLNVGTAVAGGAIAVIAPGTGLGEAFLVWDGAGYRAFPSEGGHANFAPATDTEISLLRYLQQRFDHISVERVCSGIGIPHLYDFFRDSNAAPESPELAAQLTAAEDQTPLIIESALHLTAPDQLCQTTLDTFVSILGSEAGNLALKVLATGGVYLSGGLPPRILPMLDSGLFIQAFQRKGCLSEMLARIPVHAIIKQVALFGAASYGLNRLHAKTNAS